MEGTRGSARLEKGDTMFGAKRPDRKEPEEQANPRIRSTIYAMAALYLLYMYVKMAWPFLTKDPYGPTQLQFVLGTVILGGGGIALAVLSWRMYQYSKIYAQEQRDALAAGEEDGPDDEGLPEDEADPEALEEEDPES